MTIAEFLDRVPWAEMDVCAGNIIRHRVSNVCPINAAGGDWARPALRYRLGLRHADAQCIIGAADNRQSKSRQRLRAEMLRRMNAANSSLLAERVK